jgi:hypothetical protein
MFLHVSDKRVMNGAQERRVKISPSLTHFATDFQDTTSTTKSHVCHVSLNGDLTHVLDPLHWA